MTALLIADLLESIQSYSIDMAILNTVLYLQPKIKKITTKNFNNFQIIRLNKIKPCKFKILKQCLLKNQQLYSRQLVLKLNYLVQTDIQGVRKVLP